ncbi:MAG TPA: cyclic nucleotide-binding domain-containing protein [Candidatus Limnocylindrales bacterium]|nr:cyclic nucleotide-binding domain-containing protein [Candidatus Limnocylindrales bacterium]
MAPKDPKLDLLHSIGLFSRLDRRDLERLGQLVDEVEVPAGKVLMRQGDTGSEAFVVVSGRLAVVRSGQPLEDRGPGEIVGEIALLSEGPRTATVTAAERTRLLVLGHREFHALMDEQPAIRLAVLDELAVRLRSLEDVAAH